MDAIQADLAHLELGDLFSVDWYGVPSEQETASESDDEVFLECVVCQYWSERVEEAWHQHRNALKKARRLQRLLKDHQRRGACARRMPTILTDLKHAHGFAPTCDTAPASFRLC